MADHTSPLIVLVLDHVRKHSHAIAEYIETEYLLYCNRRINKGGTVYYGRQDNDIRRLNRFFRSLLSEYDYGEQKCDALSALTWCPSEREWLYNFKRFVVPLLVY